MARAIWKGAISFGLVNIPVEIYPAEDRKSFKFSMLDKRDLSPVGYKRYSKESGKEVEWADVVKGYEYEKDQYVVLVRRGFQARQRQGHADDRNPGVRPRREVPPEYFETPYYLAPGDRGEKVYALLRETLRSDRPHRRCAGRDAHHAASRRGAAGGPRADADHAALRGRAARREGLELPAEGLKEAARDRQGSRSRQAPDRRHDRELGPVGATRTPITKT